MFTKSQFVLLLNLACGCLLSFSWTPQLVSRIRHPRVVKVNSIEHETSSEAKKICAAVIVPGFLSGAGDFAALAKCLTAQGIPTVVVPMPVWHWLPCLGGRSMRPILERIDHTVKHLAANGGNVDAVPRFEYSLADCVGDFKDNPGGVAKVGGSDEVDDYPVVEPRGCFPAPTEPLQGRVALIGHSAGGWISRVYLSERPYGGKVYAGAKFVHSLVTLGTPHSEAPGPAFSGIRWADREGLLPQVRGLAVGGTGTLGIPASGQLTMNSYSFCIDSNEDLDGDGITPIDSALAMPGTLLPDKSSQEATSSPGKAEGEQSRQESNVDTLILPGVTHFPWSDVFGGGVVAPELTARHKEGMPWYGSPEIIDLWAPWLAKECGCNDFRSSDQFKSEGK